MQSHKYQHKTKALRRQYQGNFLWDSVVRVDLHLEKNLGILQPGVPFFFFTLTVQKQLTVVMVTCMGGLCNSVCYLSIPSSCCSLGH